MNMAAETHVVKHLVVDAGGFIRNAPIREIGEQVYTIPEVVHESCDKATRQRLQVLPYTLNFKKPSAEAIIHVSDLAKKTGDYRNLSATDINVLALTYMLQKQYGAQEEQKEDEQKEQETVQSEESTEAKEIVLSGENLLTEDPEEGEPEEEWREEDHQIVPCQEELQEDETLPEDTEGHDSLVKNGHAEVSEEDEVPAEDGEDEQEQEEEDGDGEWITPSNITKVKHQFGFGPAESEEKNVTVGCLTTDFAMQNVLIQMGLHVVSVDGMLIKQARSYVLRCFACFKIIYNTMKVFCPNCGNKTLKRVAMQRDSDGKAHFFFSRRPLNTKGMKFPLPMPKGGKHANNPVLFEDQPTPQQRGKKGKQAVDVFDPDYIAGSSPFAVHDTTSRAATIGISQKHDFRNSAYWLKRNPNEPRKRHGRKK